MELDEGQEIFQECKDSLSDLNFEHETEKGSLDENKDSSSCKQTKNNHHIVHVGIIVVLLTIYLGTISVQQCLVSCVENASINEQLNQHKNKLVNYLQDKEKLEKNQILDRLLEYKDICKDLEIFTKATERKRQEKQAEEKDYTNEILKDIEGASGGTEEDNSMEYEYSSSGNDNCVQANRNKPKKSKYFIKTAGTKNGFNKHNKSTKFKYQKIQKKDLNLNKKNSTAEPIIYLFALVFIYLLLKAASDINQHYKTHNKSDKRLRRCSLQSYAQTHRSDRRASKELAFKHKQQQQLKQRLISLARSASQDQQNYNHHHQHQQHLREGLTQKSIEQTQQATNVSPKISNDSYTNNWQLLRQHTTTQSVDNSDIVNSTRGNAEISSTMLARRCSVPSALSYQKQKFSAPSPLSIANDHVNLNVSSSRRTSITSSALHLSNESLAPEVKRRVRMINRH